MNNNDPKPAPFVPDPPSPGERPKPAPFVPDPPSPGDAPPPVEGVALPTHYPALHACLACARHPATHKAGGEDACAMCGLGDEIEDDDAPRLPELAPCPEPAHAVKVTGWRKDECPRVSELREDIELLAEAAHWLRDGAEPGATVDGRNLMGIAEEVLEARAELRELGAVDPPMGDGIAACSPLDVADLPLRGGNLSALSAMFNAPGTTESTPTRIR